MAKKRTSPNAIERETSPSLVRLFQARNEWDRLYQLSNILKEAQIDLPDFFDSPHVWSSICRESNSEKLAWRLSQEIGRRAEGKMPRCLEPYADRPDFAREQQAQDLAQFQTEMQQWLNAETEPPATAPRRELRVIWKVVPGKPPLDHQVQIELRANSPKLREGPRNFFQVRGLCHELANRPELFSAEDALLLRWISDYIGLLLTDKNKHASPFLTDHRSLLAWLQHWGHTGRCRYEDGSPVEFSMLPAQIVPTLDESAGEVNGDGVKIDFQVVTAGGLREPLAQADLFLSNKEENGRLELELARVKGCFYRLCERPPVSLLALAGRNGPLRLENSATRRLLPPLIKRFPTLQSQVRVHLKQIPAVAKFYFTLDADDALCVRMRAAARHGHKVWEWGIFGWMQGQASHLVQGEKVAALPGPESDLNGDAPSPPLLERHAEQSGIDFWDEVPAETDCTEAIEWLRQWGGEPGDLFGRPDEPGWWLTLHGQTVGRLIRLWEERSHQWQYFGNRRFQQLITGRRRSFPKLKIQASGVDWFTVKTEWEEESLRLTEGDWQKLRQNTDPFIKLSDGTWLAEEEAAQLGEVATALAELGLGLSEGEQRINTMQITGVENSLWERLESSGGSSWRDELQKLRHAVEEFKGIPPVELPRGLIAHLRPYQQEGLNFLTYASRLRLGAILADDMGLGKTVQALAWLQHLREQQGPAPCLVVCPASVVFNWHREAQQFTPELKVLILTAGEQRHSLRREIPGHDLILTNYALLRRDLAELKKFSFRAIILDEAQYIKNPDSLVAKAARVLNGQHRLALTGTPLENRLLDLWSLAEFVLPGYLPSRARFTEEYDRGASVQSRALLSSRLRPLILRRLKSQVAKDLPDRIEERLDCELAEGQRKFYLAELQRTRQAWRDLDPAEAGHSRIHALAALTRLRQICCHPQLAGGKAGLGSGKTSAFLDLIDTLWAGGHKVLVFSQFVEMLKILQQELAARGRPHYLLTGQTTQRGEVVEAFQNDPQPAVFLLSLKAAGTGLNLTSASYVILYDPWWNPAVEAQAIDRTHRIGQHRTVIAYRLVTRDTVEEKIWQLQQNKSQLFKDVLGEQGFTASLTEADLEYLLEAPEEEGVSVG